MLFFPGRGAIEVDMANEKIHKMLLDQLDYKACECCCPLCPKTEEKSDAGKVKRKNIVEMVKKCNPGPNEFRPLTFAEYTKFHKILGHDKASRMAFFDHGPRQIPFPDEETHKIFLDQLDYAACDCCCSLCPENQEDSSDEDEEKDRQETAKENAKKVEEKPLDFNLFYSCFQYFYKNKTD